MGRQNERTGSLRCGHLGGLFCLPLGDKWENPRNKKGITCPLQVPYTKTQ